MMNELLAWLYWNPPRDVFTIPIIDRPIAWYGLWFVFGFVVAYFLLIPMFETRLQDLHKPSSRKIAFSLVDRLTWYMVLGTIIGARLGHVFFYDWHLYKHHLLDIFKIWEGGLASHGAALGIFLGLFFYQKRVSKDYHLTFLSLLDMIAVPAGFAACCIRIGNFFNQEILGVPSTLPWAIRFGDPIDGEPWIPRHPVQLYEALFYLIVFVLLLWLWKKPAVRKSKGLLSGIFFLLVFSFRFFIEFLKMPQSTVFNESFLQAGQWLSVPYVVLGLTLIVLSLRNCRFRSTQV